MNRFCLLCLALTFLVIPALCQPVPETLAREIAAATLGSHAIKHTRKLYAPDGQTCIGFCHELNPQGFIIISGFYELPPLIAYSYESKLDEAGRFLYLISQDLNARLANLPQTPADVIRNNKASWDRIAGSPGKPALFQQWPPAGSTTTGGWLETNWTQNAPYNALCPMDPVTATRSIAGCPAVAMAQILNYHQTINGVAFSNADDYLHNYAGRVYWIDDDADSLDFPSFPDLNGDLYTLSVKYSQSSPLTNKDKGALVFACGVAAKQVFTSAGSGTFGVNQAFDAYHKFNFIQCELLDNTDTNLYTRMAQNIMDSLPVHLAVVNTGWTSGHNVVVDGYNSDGYFHLNFGWGGQANAWYLLPAQIPYGLTVIEGAVVDIIPNVITGLSPLIPEDFYCYPNPARETLQVVFPGNASCNLQIVDMQGRVVLERFACYQGMRIDISGIKAGAYMLRCSTGKQIAKRKLIIGMTSN